MLPHGMSVPVERGRLRLVDTLGGLSEECDDHEHRAAENERVQDIERHQRDGSRTPGRHDAHGAIDEGEHEQRSRRRPQRPRHRGSRCRDGEEKPGPRAIGSLQYTALHEQGPKRHGRSPGKNDVSVHGANELAGDEGDDGNQKTTEQQCDPHDG